MVDLAENLQQIHEGMERAAARVGRDPQEIQLLAVSKGQPPEAVKALAECGQVLFGENKVQEGKAKISLCPGKLQWHMIGHLQSNKVRDAVHFFRMIESVDSLALAAELQKAAEKAAKTVPILLEVNVAGEATKYGFSPDELKRDFLEVNRLTRLEVHGLMTIAPWTQEPERVRPFFRTLRELKSDCEQLLGAPLPQLSMGMSGDYEIAIEEGSTLVRIGTALFGPRKAALKR